MENRKDTMVELMRQTMIVFLLHTSSKDNPLCQREVDYSTENVRGLSLWWFLNLATRATRPARVDLRGVRICKLAESTVDESKQFKTFTNLAVLLMQVLGSLGQSELQVGYVVGQFLNYLRAGRVPSSTSLLASILIRLRPDRFSTRSTHTTKANTTQDIFYRRFSRDAVLSSVLYKIASFSAGTFAHCLFRKAFFCTEE